MSPRAASRRSVTTFFMGRLVGRVRSRWLLCCGFTLLAVSSFMLSDINLQVSQMRVIGRALSTASPSVLFSCR